jgi:hypothetical protein
VSVSVTVVAGASAGAVVSSTDEVSMAVMKLPGATSGNDGLLRANRLPPVGYSHRTQR